MRVERNKDDLNLVLGQQLCLFIGLTTLSWQPWGQVTAVEWGVGVGGRLGVPIACSLKEMLQETPGHMVEDLSVQNAVS